MSTAYRNADMKECVLLQNGDRMTQGEFHDLYEQMPDDFKAELIGGTVFVSMPTGKSHGRAHLSLGAIFALYEGNTFGVEGFNNATVILSKKDEVQPDLFLRVLPECKGQTHDVEGTYVGGPPELVAEVAYSSKAIDLHLKRARYKRSGVLEYIVMCLAPRELHWFDLASGSRLAPDGDGVIRSKVFPGLWLDVEALMTLNSPRLVEVLHQGLASDAHADFVARLADMTK